MSVHRDCIRLDLVPSDRVQKRKAAEAILRNMGYLYNERAELWRPPVGKKPDLDFIDSLKAERDEALARIAVLEEVLRELLDVLDVCRVAGSQKNVERSVKAQRAARAALSPPDPQQDRTEEAGR